jgi:hypothetical protein
MTAPYPKMVYPGGKPVAGLGRLVHNEAEEKAYVGSSKSAGNDALLRAVLLSQAKELGVQVDERWGMEMLQDAVNNARKA